MSERSALCEQTLAALEQDPVHLPAHLVRHVAACPACAEARVLWLAQDEHPTALAPAGYFEALPGRVLRKLPVRRRRSVRPYLWAAAGLVALLAGTGGYLAGRAGQVDPRDTAAMPAVEVLEPSGLETPFVEPDEDLASLGAMTPEQEKALVNRLKPRKP